MFSHTASSRWVVTPEWLYQQLTQPEVPLVIVDCRFALADPKLGRQHYEAGHIPNAHYLDLNFDLSNPVQPHGGRHPLPDPERFAKTLTAIGVRSSSDPTLVVAYDDSRLAFAARLWWLLRYFGHDQVAILDGGFRGWQQAGYPVTVDLPSAQPGSFHYQIRPELAVDIEVVRAFNPESQTLVDSREPERYRGEREPIDPIAGHIPGAVNYPWQDVTDAAGFIQPIAQQQQRWANLPPRSEVIVYCGSGVTACVNLLSLELAGIDAKLYPGSWSDWCSYLTTPNQQS